ncbi:MAG: SpoIIE family protein phosphatase [Spirochaetia bacterium]|nr:SpoIIE family protein phosphatase [Spirochaetia bacterium]
MKILHYLTNLISRIGSYAFAVSLTTLLSISAGFFFAYYFLICMNIALTNEILTIFFYCVLIGWILFFIQLGALRHLKLNGFGTNIKTLNILIQYKPKLTIPKSLTHPEYISLLKTINKLPLFITITSSIWLILSLNAFSYYLYLFSSLEAYAFNYLFYAYCITIFIHIGLNYILAEAATMPQRSQLKQILCEKDISFQVKYFSSIRLKILIISFFFIITGILSSLLVYYQRDNLMLAFHFFIFGIFICMITGHMAYHIIRQSLNEVKNSILKMRSGRIEYHYPGGLDREILRIAEYFYDILSNTQNYRSSFEEKLIQHKESINEINTKTKKTEAELQKNISFVSKLYQGVIPVFNSIEWNGLEISGYSKPVNQISGDYFDYLKLPGDRLGLLIADASGNDFTKALTAAVIKMSFIETAKNFSKPAEVFEKINEKIYPLTNNENFISSFFISFDENHEFIYSNAGQYPAIIHRRKEDKIENIDTDGFLLAIQEDVSNKFEEKSNYLNPGDRLFMFTDGILRAKNKFNEEFGHERFENLVLRFKEQSFEETYKGIINEIHEYTSEGTVVDDISLIIIESKPVYAKYLNKVKESVKKLASDNRSEAAELFEAAINIYDRNAGGLRNAGILFYELKDYEKAKQYLEKSIRLDNTNAESYYWISALYLRTHKFEKAAEHAKKAAGLKPYYIEALNNLAIAYTNLKNYPAAKITFEQVLSLDPNNEEIKKSINKINELIAKTL